MNRHTRAFRAAFSASIPVLFGYLSIGLAFGFLLVQAGIPWGWAPVMSLVIFAGAGQYMAIGMLAGGRSPAEMALAIFLINARHMVYGFSLLDRFAPFGAAKAYLIYGLTDETYALLTTVEPPPEADPRTFDLAVTALNHSYWIGGSLLGALLGAGLPWELPGLDFALTALFVVLLTEQIRSLKRPEPFLLGGAFFLTASFLVPPAQVLLTSIMAAAAACFLLPPRPAPPKADEETAP